MAADPGVSVSGGDVTEREARLAAIRRYLPSNGKGEGNVRWLLAELEAAERGRADDHKAWEADMLRAEAAEARVAQLQDALRKADVLLDSLRRASDKDELWRRASAGGIDHLATLHFHVTKALASGDGTEGADNA